MISDRRTQWGPPGSPWCSLSWCAASSPRRSSSRCPRHSLSNSARQSIQYRETVYPIPRDSLSNSARQSIQFRETVYPILRNSLSNSARQSTVVHIPRSIFSLGLLPLRTVTYRLCCAACSLTNSEFNHGRKCLRVVFYCDTKGSDCLDKCAANYSF
jgi:hypothetical protein